MVLQTVRDWNHGLRLLGQASQRTEDVTLSRYWHLAWALAGHSRCEGRDMGSGSGLAA